MRAVKIPPGHSLPFWIVSGTDSRVWSSPPRLMKRFKDAVEPDASLTFTGCALLEPDDCVVLAHLCLSATGCAPDGATGDASSHANTTPPRAITTKMMTEEVMSARSLIVCPQPLALVLIVRAQSLTRVLIVCARPLTLVLIVCPVNLAYRLSSRLRGRHPRPKEGWTARLSLVSARGAHPPDSPGIYRLPAAGRDPRHSGSSRWWTGTPARPGDARRPRPPPL